MDHSKVTKKIKFCETVYGHTLQCLSLLTFGHFLQSWKCDTELWQFSAKSAFGSLQITCIFSPQLDSNLCLLIRRQVHCPLCRYCWVKFWINLNNYFLYKFWKNFREEFRSGSPMGLTWCQWYKPFFSLPLMVSRNKLECFSWNQPNSASKAGAYLSEVLTLWVGSRPYSLILDKP